MAGKIASKVTALRTSIASWLAPAARAFVEPIYRLGTFRQGIVSTEQQPEAGRLVTDGFRGVQATASRAIANRLSDLELEVQRRELDDQGEPTWKAQPDHPFLEVLNRPNPLLSQRQLLKLASYWLTQSGEAFWLKVTNGAGRTVELWPMSPRNVEKISGTTSPVSAYVFHGEGGETRYSLEEVIWIFDPDPAYPFQGVGIVGPQAIEFDANTFAGQTIRSHYQHDALPKVVLESSPESPMPTKGNLDTFTAEWQNRYNKRGGESAGLPAFLPGGVTAKELGNLSASDSIPLMEFLRDHLLMANGTPRSILGDVVDANRAAADTNRLVFDRHTIQPQTGVIADAITYQCVQPELGREWRCVFTDFIDEDADLRLQQERQDLELKVRTINQVRADRGLEPVDWGEQPIGTFGETPYDPDDFDDDGSGGPPNPFAPAPDDQADDDDDQADDERAGRPFVARMVAPRIAAAMAPEREWARVMQTDAVFLPRMLSALRRVFAGQKAITVEALKAAPANERAWSRADWLDELFEREDMFRLFDTLVTPISVEVYQQTGENALRGLEERPQLAFNEAAIKEMREQGAQLVAWANPVTKERLRKTLAKGIEQGEGLDDLIRRVRKEYTTISKGRARTIARTEVGYAMSKGQLAAFEQSESVFYTKWNTALDDRVRDQHVALEGVQVREGELFTIPATGKQPSEQARAPRVAADGGRLRPHNGINCRCFDSAVLGE